MPVEITWSGKPGALRRAELPAAGRFVHWDSNKVTATGLNTNHVISGDAFDALGLLRENFSGNVDVIYIDPPYNTGRNFTYRDRWKSGGGSQHAQENWLDFMLPILVRARSLLSDSGVMFISIDDREFPALAMLVREIFGVTNHLGTIKWKRKRKSSFLDKHFSATLEYVLILARDENACPRLLGPQMQELSRPVLNAGNPICERVLRQGMPARCPDGFYRAGSRTNRTLSLDLLTDAEVRDGQLVHSVRVRGAFRVSQEILDRTGFVTSRFGLRRALGDAELDRRAPCDFYPEWPTNEDAESELRTIFGEKVFDFPKPIEMLRALLSMVPGHAARPLRCVDFFAGSGTWGEAVLRQTEEDRVPRLFTLVQLPEPISDPILRKRFSTISEITAQRARIAAKQAGLAEADLQFLRVENETR